MTRPFAGATDLEVLKTIMSMVQAQLPLPADVLRSCGVWWKKLLEKDPAERYQSMREMVVDLRRVARHSGETSGKCALGARNAGSQTEGHVFRGGHRLLQRWRWYGAASTTSSHRKRP